MSQTTKSQPLSIFYLLLWIFCIAAALGTQHFLEPEEQSGPFGELRDLSELVSSMVAGTIIMGMIVLSQRWAADEVLKLEPGHWIIILSSLQIILFQPLSWASNELMSNTSSAQLVHAVCALLPLAASSIAVVKVAYWRWKIVFFLYLLYWFLIMTCYLLVPTGYMPLSVALERAYSLIPLFLAMAVVVAISIEIGTMVRRDWLHWAGVATVLANILTVTVWRVGL